jgi:hypothetical protein
MPRRCTICDHPERADIDKALVAGEPFRNIARRSGTSVSSLHRHRQSHIVELLAKVQSPSTPEEAARKQELIGHQEALEAGELRHAIDVVQQLRAINAACLEVLKQARTDGKHAILLQAVDRIARQIELQAKLLGQIQDGQTVNVAILPEWHGLRQSVLEALQPYPEAKLAVVRALKGVGT